MKTQIETLMRKIQSHQNFSNACIEDKNVMEYQVSEKNDDMAQILNKLKKESIDN